MKWRSRHRAMVCPYKESKQQQKERIAEYLDSGAQPICKKCDRILSNPTCDCSPDNDDASIGFAWPSVYSKKQKIINFMRWVYKVQHTDSKIKGGRDMIRKSKKKERRQDITCKAKDFLKKGIYTPSGIRVVDHYKICNLYRNHRSIREKGA